MCRRRRREEKHLDDLGGTALAASAEYVTVAVCQFPRSCISNTFIAYLSKCRNIKLFVARLCRNQICIVQIWFVLHQHESFDRESMLAFVRYEMDLKRTRQREQCKSDRIEISKQDAIKR